VRFHLAKVLASPGLPVEQLVAGQEPRLEVEEASPLASVVALE